MLIGLFHHLERVYLYKTVAVRTFVCSGLVKRPLSVNMSEQQGTAGAEAPKKSTAQLKKEKLEKYEAKMKAMEASKTAAADVSDGKPGRFVVAM